MKGRSESVQEKSGSAGEKKRAKWRQKAESGTIEVQKAFHVEGKKSSVYHWDAV